MIAEFHMLAFQLLGIDYLPTPRYTGTDDPHLTDENYQELCNIVCKFVPGMTAAVWRDSSEGERCACMREALKARDDSKRLKTRTGRPRKEEAASVGLIIGALVKHHGHDPADDSIQKYTVMSLEELAKSANQSKSV